MRKKLTTWRLNNMLLKNYMETKQHAIKKLIFNEEIKKEIKKYLEINEDTATQNTWDVAKAVLRGKFIAIQAFSKKKNLKLTI